MRRADPFGTRALLGSALGTGGCTGAQSTLDTAGEGAEQVASLFWWMTGAAGLVWLVVVALATYAVHTSPKPDSPRTGRLLILLGGAVIPTVLLAALLAYGLSMLPRQLAPAPPGSLRVRVSGEQWWWRIRYLPADGNEVELANEIRVPVGEPVEFELESPDVIHSFWIPSLGGKVDMIPGRTTRLRLQATRTGTYRGACAEYCGTAHALMAFPVLVLERGEFDAWLQNQARAARAPTTPLARHGRDVFVRSGCGACHAVRGTDSAGVVGPDLTHVGSRESLGAGTLPARVEDFRRWLAQTDTIKPGVHMPAFGMLPPSELGALAAYLKSLQ